MNNDGSIGKNLHTKFRGFCNSPGQHRTTSRQRSGLCDRVLHGGERFSVTNSDIDRLQSPNTCRAFGEVGVGVYKNLQRPVQTNQEVSNNAPSNLTKGSGTNLSAVIYGNFADLLIGMFGQLEILVDPYTDFAKGTVGVRALQSIDIAVRHAESFAAMQDAIA